MLIWRENNVQSVESALAAKGKFEWLSKRSRVGIVRVVTSFWCHGVQVRS